MSDFEPYYHAGESEAEAFQAGVDKWMDACFGEPIKSDSLERADRFTEEALELAQTIPGFSADRAHALVDYVFGRPVGERGQEVGGVMVCLAALCNTFGLSVEEEAGRELTRIWTKVEQIRAKQATKPTGSALPIPQEPSRPAPTAELFSQVRAALSKIDGWRPEMAAILCEAEREASRMAAPESEADVIMRAGRCGHHFDEDCRSCRAALECTNAEMDRLRALSRPDARVELLREARRGLRALCGLKDAPRRIVNLDTGETASELLAKIDAELAGGGK